MVVDSGERRPSLVTRCGQQFETLMVKLQNNNLGRRVVKNTIATTISLIISVIPAVIRVFGSSTFLSPMTTVFAHPGQRLGMMVESQILILVGATLGMCWGLLGIYLSSFVFDDTYPGAYTIRAVFLVIAILFHGYLRSYSPRLFTFVLFHLIVATILLTKGPTEITPDLVTAVFYPILTANGIIILVNIFIYPETASSFIGKSTIQSLLDTVNAMRDAGDWFIEEALGQDATGRKGSTFSISALQAAKLANLTERKAKLRTTLAACKKAQAECNFELSYSVLPPRYLKPISSGGMTNLVQSTIALIGACESKYALIGDTQGNQAEEVGPLFTKNPFEAIPEEEDEGTPASAVPMRPGASKTPSERPKTSKSKSSKPDIAEKLKLVKPQREVESGDAEILELILKPVRKPISDLKIEIDKAIDVVTAALSYSYDVRKLPSGWVPPDGLRPEEIDIRMDIFAEAIDTFDSTSAEALASAAALEDLDSPDVDIMPRMETFLISSFLLSLRQAAIHTMNMLRHSRILVEKRSSRGDHRRFYFPQKISWRKWLASGGEEDNSALPENARKSARRGVERESRVVDEDSDSSDDEDGGPLIKKNTSDIEAGGAADHVEKVSSNNLPKREIVRARPLTTEDFEEKEKQRHEKRKHAKKEDKLKRRAAGPKTWSVAWLRYKIADALEYLIDDEDLAYAIKMVIAIMLVTWPAFVDGWKPWYSGVRGVWAPLQLIMVFEVSIGTSFWVFFVRLAGVIAGCVWGFVAYEIGSGNPYVLCFVCMLGVIPGAYVQVGTKYVKAGMIGIISMCVVALVSYSRETPSWEIFVQRLVAFVIGGTFAILVEITLYPVRARDRLVECLSSCITQMSNMQAAIAVGVDDPKKMDLHSPLIHNRFRDAKSKAQSALSAAETFLPFCLSEPRLKGSFSKLAPVYREIIYVLHQIIDRMDNTLALRRAYGSSVLEELNEEIYAHRRNVAASVTLTFFAVDEALTTRMPLPQFLPSSRLAQLRLVNKVRHSLMEKSSSSQNVAPLVMTTVTSWKLGMGQGEQLELSSDTVKSVTQQKFLAWNAAAAGQIEIIEYLEELVDLAKLLVGVNSFRSGMLERPSYVEYVRRLREKEMAVKKGEAVERAKGRGEGMEGMAKAVSDVDLEAGKRAPGHPGRMGSIKRSSTFAASMGSMKRRFTFAAPSMSTSSVPGLGASFRRRTSREVTESGVFAMGRVSTTHRRESVEDAAPEGPAPPRGSFGGPRQVGEPGRGSIEASSAAEAAHAHGRKESLRDRFNAGRLEKRSNIRVERTGSFATRKPYWEEEREAGKGTTRREDEDHHTHLAPGPSFWSFGRRSSERRSTERVATERRPSGEHQRLQSGQQSPLLRRSGEGTRQSTQSPEDIPVSLQRMRTRMVDEMGVERRRRMTLLQQQQEAGGSGSSSVAGGGGFFRERRVSARLQAAASGTRTPAMSPSHQLSQPQAQAQAQAPAASMAGPTSPASPTPIMGPAAGIRASFMFSPRLAASGGASPGTPDSGAGEGAGPSQQQQGVSPRDGQSGVEEKDPLAK